MCSAVAIFLLEEFFNILQYCTAEKSSGLFRLLRDVDC